MKKVICFGTFDVLHLGHVDYFTQAKEYGDHLTVVIARDQTKQDQQKELVFSEQERLRLVESLEIVDAAVLGHHGNHLKVIEDRKPDVICLGYDHPVSVEELREKLLPLHLYPEIRRMKPYKEDSQKSHKIKQKFLQQ